MVRARRVGRRIIFACAVAHCGGVVGPTSSSDGDASIGDQDASAPVNGDNDADAPMFGDAALPPPRDAGGPAPPLDAGDPPMQACADDAGSCSIPSSVCADALWLVYYVGGDCNGGVCHWEKRFLYCGGNCVNGGCRSTATPPVPR
jgi:hypothetical protein